MQDWNYWEQDGTVWSQPNFCKTDAVYRAIYVRRALLWSQHTGSKQFMVLVLNDTSQLSQHFTIMHSVPNNEHLWAGSQWSQWSVLSSVTTVSRKLAPLLPYHCRNVSAAPKHFVLCFGIFFSTHVTSNFLNSMCSATISYKNCDICGATVLLNEMLHQIHMVITDQGESSIALFFIKTLRIFRKLLFQQCTTYLLMFSL